MSTKPATILASESQTMKSVHTGREYQVTISLPYAYQEQNPLPFFNVLEKWPVVYLLDANWHFGMITDVVRSMSWYGTTKEAIVVGIGYQEDETPQKGWTEAVVQRAIDFTPTADRGYENTYGPIIKRSIATGDALNFHQFLKEELIPFIEEKYQADPSRRILAGQSLGGLFGTFALFQEPQLFANYIISSPFLGFGNKFMFGFEEAFSKKYKELLTKAYFTIGENEERVGEPLLSDFVEFMAILESRNYHGFNMKKKIFAGLNHTEVVAPGFHAGLMWALKK